jgi:DNA-binding response OmpR family regulator
MNMKNKIFICEDDPGISEVMNMILEGEGYETKCFNNGRNIEKEIEEGRPDLILLDLWMPEMDGEAIIAKLKGNEGTNNIPIIIVSAASDIERVAIQYKADNYLRKPFHIDELASVVKETIKKSKEAIV